MIVATLTLAVALIRGPYLGRPDDRSVAIVWRTDIAADSRVEYAAAEGGGPTFSVEGSQRVITHKVRIDGLTPGATYRYQIYSDGVALGAPSTFRAPREEGDFNFAIIGDTNQRWIPEIIAHHLADEDPDFAIHTGDVVYPDGADELYDDEFFLPLAPLLRKAAILPLIGDHDAQNPGAQTFLDNFVLPGSRYYSFRQSNALFIAVDIETSAFGKGSAQYESLLRQLATTDARWKFVYVHQPPYSSDRSSGVVRLALSPLFERYGVDVVFSGNSHLYERTKPICDFGYRGCRGVVYITEGGGGAGLSTFKRQKFTAVVIARHGYTIGSVSDRELTLVSHDMDGNEVDRVVLRK